MSFLHGALLQGGSALHNTSDRPVEAASQAKRLRKSQSHASYLGGLNPLVRLVRDPVTSIEGLLERVWIGEERQEEDPEAEDDDRRKQLLRVRMTDAAEYSTWRSAAMELDRLEANDEWKLDPESPFYDHIVLQARLHELNEARLSGDTSRMLFLLRTSLTRSLGNMGDINLYKHSHIGTKVLIEDYISAACATLEALTTSSESKLEPRFTLDQLLATRQAFGRSALLLSGGGTFGMNHSGVVKALWESHLLPRIVSGSSAGAIVSAVLCTKTDEEIPETLDDFCYGDLEVFEKKGEEESLLRKAARFAKFGSVFDIQHLVKVMRGLLGDLTFQEAYNRTRRILNISVSSASLHELPRLLNYVTAPNVIIWSAVAASCSVPFIFSPASILAKDPRTGAEVPWNTSPQRWIDGSVDNDLPMTRLAEMFNVNHFVVSQVNPHVVPFLVSAEKVTGTNGGHLDSAVVAGSGWLHTMASFAKTEAMHRMQVLAELGVFPNYFTKIRSVLSQKYSGDITILPEISYAHFPRVLQNPSAEFMIAAMLAGERATWPKLSRIQNHCAIELALDAAVQKLRAKMVFSPSQVDLRMKSIQTSRQRSSVIGRGVRTAVSKSTKRTSTSFKRRSHDNSGLQIDQRPNRRLSLKFSGSATKLDTSDSDSEADGDITPYIKLSLPRKRKGRRTHSPDSDSDSPLSNPRSFSPSSAPGSPASPTPELWPSTRQLFPSRSQPATPVWPTPHRRQPSSSSTLNLGSRWILPGHNDNSSLELSMTTPTPAAQTTPGPVRRGPVPSMTAGTVSTPAPNLVVDVSGTRGMVLRRKKSRSLY